MDELEKFKPVIETTRRYRTPVLTFKGRCFTLSSSARKILQDADNEYFRILINEDTKQIVAQPSNNRDFHLHGHQNMWGRTALVRKVQHMFDVNENVPLRMIGEILPQQQGLIFRATKSEEIED